MSPHADHFPILDIQAFSEYPEQGYDLLFHELRGRNFIDRPHRHDFFIILLFEKGRGVHTIDFKEHKISDKQVNLVFPNQVHQWHIAQGTVGYQLMISRKWFEVFWPAPRYPASCYQHHPVFTVPEETYRLLLHEFIAIKNELKQESGIFWELIQSRSKTIGLLVNKAVNAGRGSADHLRIHPVIGNLLDLADQYFRQQRSVSFYAGKLNISANYLNVICRKNLGTTASSLIKDRILLEAKRLLKVSEMSVKDIVYELDFYDHASFTRFFKELTGMTPSQFREKN